MKIPNDAGRLSIDPAIRHLIGGRAKEHQAASTSQMGRFETEILTQPDNLKVLMSLPGQWVDQVRVRQPATKLILDMDSSDSPTYAHQEGSAYSGHFRYTWYHALFCFNQYPCITPVYRV